MLSLDPQQVMSLTLQEAWDTYKNLEAMGEVEPLTKEEIKKVKYGTLKKQIPMSHISNEWFELSTDRNRS